jgi:tripartite-type tricarboxylate transporter receptor subunit TctC
MRALAAAASKHLPHPITIENRPGASGLLGPATMVATARPDGYTICQLVLTVFRAPHTQTLTFDPRRDFSFVIHTSGFLIGTFARTDSPFASARDAIEFARANPGKLTYGTPGTGTTNHLTFEQLALKAGVKATHVPFKGESEMYAAVLGNHVMLGVGTGGAGALVDAGQFRWLHTYGRQRTKRWPQVPTATEDGYAILSESPYGIAGPKGMDPAVVRILHDALKKGLDDPEHMAFLDRQTQPLLYLNSEDYARYAIQLYNEQGELMRALGMAKN